ncbi:MAG: YraN family protein [Desulfurococcales archaeon]|nr:YraN family protein [Desulfurococcales archaeon]
MSGKWRSSEALAASLLEELGYRVIEYHKRLEVDGVEVSDIDIVAERDGDIYAVEVKAGMADVNAIRQAYVNATLAGMKPLIISRGADDRALKVAEKLGVEIITLPDLLVAGPDEIREIVVEAVWDALVRIASIQLYCEQLRSEIDVIRAIAESETINDAASTLGVGIEEIGRRIDMLRKMGLIPRPVKYKMVRVISLFILATCGGKAFQPSATS